MLRQDAGRFMLGQYLIDQKIPEYLQNTHQKIFKICIKRSSKFVSKYLNIYLQNFSQNLQNSFQKQKNLVHPLQTCVFLSKPKFTLIKKSAPPEAIVFHSRQGYFRQRCSHDMARQDKSKSFHMSRASPERRYGHGVMKIERRRGTVGCRRRLDEDQQKRRCANTGIV